MEKLDNLIKNLEKYDKVTDVTVQHLIVELMLIKKDLSKQLLIQRVSNRRELLITFAQSLFDEGILHRDKANKLAENYESNL